MYIDLVPSKLELSSYTNYRLELGFLWVHCFIFCCENVSFAFHLPFQVPPFQKPLSTVCHLSCVHIFFFKVAQSCPTLCNPLDYSLPGSSVHGILQERILEWGFISFSRGSSQPRDWTWVSHIEGGFFTS